MKLSLLWVGKTKDRNIDAAIRRYMDRIGRYIPVDVLEAKEETAAGRHAVAEVIQKEGRRLREKIPAGNEVVLLDARGRELSSEEFARFLERKINSSSSSLKGLTFLVGGHLGVDGGTREVADHTISLSRMTLTHEMARLVAVEQIYRGLSIIHGAQYHRR
ncbi:MAG TPA: 23S rRNA (pseudouridine(1915)-N(3))-methyltransferase RlmH [Candidatus Polarisedimenticolia bacterium]